METEKLPRNQGVSVSCTKCGKQFTKDHAEDMIAHEHFRFRSGRIILESVPAEERWA